MLMLHDWRLWPPAGGCSGKRKWWRARTTKEITSTYFWLFVWVDSFTLACCEYCNVGYQLSFSPSLLKSWCRSLFFGESFQSFRWGSASHLNGYITHPESAISSAPVEPVAHSTIKYYNILLTPWFDGTHFVDTNKSSVVVHRWIVLSFASGYRTTYHMDLSLEASNHLWLVRSNFPFLLEF